MSEFTQGMLHAATQNTGEVRPHKYGRISSYDPDKHAVTVIIDEDEDEEAAETDWICLGGMGVGNRIGLQIAPFGGATLDNDKGESVSLDIVDRENGMATAGAMMWTDKHKPPGGEADDDEQTEQDEDDKKGWDEDPLCRKRLEGGEGVLRLGPGTALKVYKDGSMQIWSTKDLHVYVKEEANIVVREGDLNVKVEKGDLKAEVLEGDANLSVEMGDCNTNLMLGDMRVALETGDLSVNLVAGNADLTAEVGNVSVNAPSGAVTVQSLTAEVIADTVLNLVSPLVNAGNPELVQRLCNEAFMLLFNNHIHVSAEGPTSPPTLSAELGIHTTTEFAAS